MACGQNGYGREADELAEATRARKPKRLPTVMTREDARPGNWPI